MASAQHRRHGETGTYLHDLWDNMRRRCYSPTANNYRYWGGRGVQVCDEWNASYEAFAAWVRANLGERPTESHSLDRIDNAVGYQPGNVRWATPAQQTANRRPYRKRPAADVRELIG